MAAQRVPHSDILIAGAGIIGLSLALELNARGAQVTVLERDTALSHASIAAAGMLAADDPHNPAELLGLAELSLRLYPEFLAGITKLSGLEVPFQTDTTVQQLVDGSSIRLAERSIDPRQLATALLAAVRASGIDLREHVGDLEVADTPAAVYLRDARGNEFSAPFLIHATGAWFRGQNAVAPRKGQMLRVQLPRSSSLCEVHRSERVYVVPRTAGPQAGTALIGATVEDAGFDTTVRARDLARLRELACELVPQIADAPEVGAWAGLRPASRDGLPLLGALPFSPREIAATGHFRNGILLAPATAKVIADTLQGKPASVDLAPFSPERFSLIASS